jgi:predicted membrane-bound dolichyl-phosphate-mannose-protein mannosyltransferase
MNRHIIPVIVLTFFSLVVRLYKLEVPDREIGDEVYYVPSARSILGQNEEGLPIDPRRGHPPLGKMLIALGMLIFGDNPFGWRIMSAVAGTIAIPLFYLLVRRLLWGRKEMAYSSLMACYLFAFEALTFYFSRVARLDIFMMVFFIAGVYFLLADRLHRKVLSAPFFAASFLAKEAALIMILPLIFYAGLKNVKKSGKIKTRGWTARIDWRAIFRYACSGLQCCGQALYYLMLEIPTSASTDRSGRVRYTSN